MEKTEKKYRELILKLLVLDDEDKFPQLFEDKISEILNSSNPELFTQSFIRLINNYSEEEMRRGFERYSNDDCYEISGSIIKLFPSNFNKGNIYDFLQDLIEKEEKRYGEKPYVTCITSSTMRFQELWNADSTTTPSVIEVKRLVTKSTQKEVNPAMMLGLFDYPENEKSFSFSFREGMFLMRQLIVNEEINNHPFNNYLIIRNSLETDPLFRFICLKIERENLGRYGNFRGRLRIHFGIPGDKIWRGSIIYVPGNKRIIIRGPKKYGSYPEIPYE